MTYRYPQKQALPEDLQDSGQSASRIAGAVKISETNEITGQNLLMSLQQGCSEIIKF